MNSLNCQIIVDNSQHDHVSQMWSCQPVQLVSLSLSLMWEWASRAGGMSTMMPPAMPLALSMSLTSWSSQRRKRNQKPCARPEDWIYCHTVAWLPASQPLAAPRNQCMSQIRSGSAAIVWDSRSRSATHMHWRRRAVGGTVKAQRLCQTMSLTLTSVPLGLVGINCSNQLCHWCCRHSMLHNVIDFQAEGHLLTEATWIWNTISKCTSEIPCFNFQ